MNNTLDLGYGIIDINNAKLLKTNKEKKVMSVAWHLKRWLNSGCQKLKKKEIERNKTIFKWRKLTWCVSIKTF